MDEMDEQPVRMQLGGVVVTCRTDDLMVAGLTLSWGTARLGKLFMHMCLCSPSSIIWYRPKGGDALQLGR